MFFYFQVILSERQANWTYIKAKELLYKNSFDRRLQLQFNYISW